MFQTLIRNIHLAGMKGVEGILNGWDSTLSAAIGPMKYVGDILGSLGGTPNFGPATSNDNPVRRRELGGRRLGNRGMMKHMPRMAWRRECTDCTIMKMRRLDDGLIS